MFKSGFINIIGLPNAGKSSIINRLLGEKFSIITSKAQTTRHRAYGIINGKNHQAIISDTPGFTSPTNKIHEYMNKKILESFKDADIILLIVELGVKSESNNKLVDKINKSKKQKKGQISKTRFVPVCSGSWTRTSDLRVMSPTSYLLLYPAMLVYKYTPFLYISISFF